MEQEIIEKLMKILLEVEREHFKKGEDSKYLWNNDLFIETYLTPEELNLFKKMLDYHRLISRYYSFTNDVSWRTHEKYIHKKQKEKLQQFIEFIETDEDKQ